MNPETDNNPDFENSKILSKDNFSIVVNFFQRRRKILIVIGIFLFIIIGLLLFSFQSKPNPTENSTVTVPTIPGFNPLNPQISGLPINYPTSSANQQDKAILAVVGEESIYRKDVNLLIENIPKGIGVDYVKMFTDKMIEESIVLQGARKDKIASLDPTVFNSVNIDLAKRSALAKQIKETIDNKADKIEGSIISIWFYNDELGSLGLEGGKRLAFDKIKPLQEQVKNKTMTMVQAGDIIKKDASLSQVDKVYDTNAIANFSIYKGNKITFDEAFDQILWGLKEGETSEVVLIQGEDYTNGGKRDKLYSFGRVSKRRGDSGNLGFDAWLNNNKKIYEIQYL